MGNNDGQAGYILPLYDKIPYMELTFKNAAKVSKRNILLNVIQHIFVTNAECQISDISEKGMINIVKIKHFIIYSIKILFLLYLN